MWERNLSRISGLVLAPNMPPVGLPKRFVRRARVLPSEVSAEQLRAALEAAAAGWSSFTPPK